MSIVFNEDKSVAVIEEYSLYEFVMSIEACHKEGYRHTTDNDYFVTGFNGYYRCGMKKEIEDVVQEPNKTDEKPAGTIQAKPVNRGRPKQNG